ncbi:MAG: hypothetical protein V4471_02385 [Pseudomonadota bacterium]
MNKLNAIINSNLEFRKILIQRDGLNVFFIEKEKLETNEKGEIQIDFLSLRKELQEILVLPSGTCFQVIGDSNPFSKLGHRYAGTVLQTLMQKHQGPVLYGFTSNKDGGANGVVGEWLENNPEYSNKVVANIVYPESIIAIQDWECTYSEAVKNYLVVFDDQKDCHFGDDVALSDNLAKKLLCLEGGVISFCQIVNTLIYHDDPEITVIHGLRDKKNRSWFSAAELISKLKKANSIEDSIKIKNAYLNDKKLYDPSGKLPSPEIIKVKEDQVNTAFQALIASKNSLEKLKGITVNECVTPKLTKSELFQLPNLKNAGSYILNTPLSPV